MSLAARLEVAGIRLEVARFPGSAGRSPILMLHEGLGSISLWRDFPLRLARASGRAVVAWSRQGHGHSEFLPDPWGVDYMHREAAAVPALMDALEIDRAHLFGHSDGGSIALIAAAGAPERVASLLLEAPHVRVEERTLAGIAAVGAAYATTDLGARLARHHADPDRVFRRWRDIWLDPGFRDWTIEALLPAIRAPTLLIQGRDDEYGTLDQLDRIAAALAGTSRLELDSCRHSPHRDRPLAVLDAVLGFLSDIDP